jgi:hypothetical protein
VTRAISTMRAAEQEETISRLLSTEASPTIPVIFGLDREKLRGVSIGGLASLFEAHSGAYEALSLQMSTSRSMEDGPCLALLGEASERSGFAMDEIVEELESRTPIGAWERMMRAKILVGRYAEAGDWVRAMHLAAKTVGGRS